MLVIPAIDVRGGRCVRLLQGDYARETVYAEDPGEMALHFLREGAQRIHVVDLDAARGRPDVLSRDAVRRAVRSVADAGGEVELGGGIRSEEAVRAWLSAGAAYVVMGSLAVGDPVRAEAATRAFPGRVLLALDLRGITVQAQGWTSDAGTADVHLQRWRSWPVAGIVHTDVGRDGALVGPDIDGLRECVARSGKAVIASGGISSLDDLEACATAGAAGAIVGRAVYEGRIDVAEALRRFPPGIQA